MAMFSRRAAMQALVTRHNYTWRKRYGGMAKSQLAEFKTLEKENARLKRIVTDLELDKLILKETLDYLKPKA